jgi:stage V sporulation protein G
LPIVRAWERKENDVEITEVRIKLMEEPGERLKAFCSITFDNCFVVRDLKIIDGSNGPFVAMPSRKLTTHCPGCGMKNHLRAQFCNQCGKRLNDSRAPKDADGRAKLYADIAHPINSFCREMIQDVVINEFYEEIERAKQPGYVSRYDDFDFEYTDAARSKPARFDQPHSRPAEQPHVRPKTVAASDGVPKAHFRSDSAADGHASPHAPPVVGTDGFGAGIFPE